MRVFLLMGAAALCGGETVSEQVVVPFWTASKPNISKPNAGFEKLDAEFNAVAFYGSEAGGFYNHAAMWHYHNQQFTLSWKNAPESEDTPGQRVLYSQSVDGEHWTDAQVLFPNMSTNANPAAQFAGPYAVLNGRLYATSTPAIISEGDAQGAQWCLWPDGLDPRNCATPDAPGSQPNGTLMMRRIFPGVGTPPGPIFWVSPDAPAAELQEASTLNNISSITDMDATTQSDISLLTPHMEELPCADDAGTLKCEGCKEGCQLYDTLPHIGIANERTHWDLPAATKQRLGHNFTDVIVYRSHDNVLYSSVRDGTTGEWSEIDITTIPNDNSNINAGVLPDGRTFLLANAAPNTIRDPLTVAISDDGLNFSSCFAIQTCHDLPNR